MFYGDTRVYGNSTFYFEARVIKNQRQIVQWKRVNGTGTQKAKNLLYDRGVILTNHLENK